MRYIIVLVIICILYMMLTKYLIKDNNGDKMETILLTSILNTICILINYDCINIIIMVMCLLMLKNIKKVKQNKHRIILRIIIIVQIIIVIYNIYDNNYGLQTQQNEVINIIECKYSNIDEHEGILKYLIETNNDIVIDYNNNLNIKPNFSDFCIILQNN